jgi:hypothetical protein
MAKASSKSWSQPARHDFRNDLVLVTLAFRTAGLWPAFLTWFWYRWPPAGVVDFLFEAK